jgi:two-component system, sensor histidine kinase LadS
MRGKIESSHYVWLLIIQVICGGPLAAQSPFELNDAREETILRLKDIEYFTDTTNSLSIQIVSSVEFSDQFKVNPNYQNKDYRAGSTYWLRLPVVHKSGSKYNWLLEFYDQTIDDLQLFVPVNGVYQRHQLGDHQAFEDREYLHKNFGFTLDIEKDTVLTYYFRVHSHEFADIRIALKSIPRFVNYGLNEYFLFGTFYGMILIISLYNFLVYLAVREIKYIFYIGYILSVALYAMSYDGIGFQYLWPNHPKINDYASGISLFSVILWAFLFTRRFLDTQINAPQLNRILIWTLVVRSVVFLSFLFFKPSLFSIRVLDIIPLSIIFYTAYHVWKTGFKPARFFLIAYGVLFFGFFIRMLVYFDFIPLTILSHYSLHFSFVFEMLFLTFALGDRIRILKANQDQAMLDSLAQSQINLQLKDQVNRELEGKVHERTVELENKSLLLEDMNNKLVTQAKEINQINSMLDLDNWKLKNRVKEVLNEMLLEQTMTYQEFKTLYPDKFACYRFLESYKWEKGFVCHKCRNDKYFDGAKKFSRRCTRCGHDESITANTIFHGVKFPIEKAFYIAYLTVGGRQKETLSSLSERLSLSVNTVWGFRSKVSRILKENENRGKKISVSKWEQVIGEKSKEIALIN